MSADPNSNQGANLFFGVILGSIALVTFVVVLLFGIQMTGAIATELGSAQGPTNKTASPDPEINTAVEFEDTSLGRNIIEVFRVRDSTGFAVNLTGADDSYVQSQSEFDIASDDNWTVATYARVDNDSGTDNMTAISANGRVMIDYNGSQGNWSAWYFDEGSRNSWRVNISAPDQPGNFSLVMAQHNGSHLRIFRGNTLGETVNTSSGENIENISVSNTNFDGRLDETRTFDSVLNSSQRQAYTDYGIIPLDNATRTARITYDEGSGSTSKIYFTATSLDLFNFTWDTGLQGTELTEGTDYEISEKDGTITALDTVLINDAPVVWIDYRFESLNDVGRISENLEPAFQLFGVSSMVIPAVVIIGLLLGGLMMGVMAMSSDMDQLRRGNR